MTDQTMTPEQALEWLEGLRNTTGDQVCAEIEAGKAAEAAQAFRAALEAAREDAERYRWLRRDAVFAGWSMPKQPIPCPDRIAGCMVAHSSWELSGAALDAAIDQARGKGGA